MTVPDGNPSLTRDYIFALQNVDTDNFAQKCGMFATTLNMHHVVATQGVKTELFSRPIIFTLMYLACSKSVRVQREKRNFKGTKRNVAYYLRDFVFSLLFD